MNETRSSRPGQEVSLVVPPGLPFLPVVTAFAEKSAGSFGLAGPEALSLTLAAEEIFSHLAGPGASGEDVRLACRGGVYYVEMRFSFQTRFFNMQAFNLTSSVACDGEDLPAETGLLIASRMVDRIRVHYGDNRLEIALRKEKNYPEAAPEGLPAPRPLAAPVVRMPDPETLKLLSYFLKRHAPEICPARFLIPGKLADMVASGEYGAALLEDAGGPLGGGIVWRREGAGLVEFFGPYLFGRPAGEEAAVLLVEACIAAVAKSDAAGMMSRYPSPLLPEAYFEVLGSMAVSAGDARTGEVPVHYRQLREDAGGVSWAHPLLHPFLKEVYGRLSFARELRPVREEGEAGYPFSVLSAEFDHAMRQAILRPLWWGSDAAANLGEHVRTLSREDPGTVLLFEIDLGRPWHARFTPPLFAVGFRPRVILPAGGRGDLVLFQHEAGGGPR